MAALTLLEAAKESRESGETLKAGIIEQYASKSPILDVLAFEEVAGGTVEWMVEKTLPNTANRAINEAWVNGVGEVDERIEKVVIQGGEIKIDTAIIKLKGVGVLNTQVTMKLKALQSKFHSDFFNGDQSVNGKQFSGLRARAGGTQLVDAGTTSGGDVLSLSKLRRAVSRVRPLSAKGFVRIFSNLDLALRYGDAISNPAVSGYIVQTKDEFGIAAPTFMGIPWYPIEEDQFGNSILPFTEAAPGGGVGASSIYIVAFGASDLNGIQTGGIDVRDLGEMQTENNRLIRLDWLANFATYNPRSFCRLRGIKDGAFAA